MAERRQGPSGKREVDSAEEHFKREGPEPPEGDTGDTVEEMNEAAERSIGDNIEPQQSVK